MEKKRRSLKFILGDIFCLALIILPIAFGIVLKVLFTPASNGIEVTGARIYFTIHMPIQDLPITEAQVNSWIVILALLGLCLFLTHGIKKIPDSKRQLAAEWLVEKASGIVGSNMGEYFVGFTPFIMAIMGLSAFSSLLTLVGLFPPTSDINIIAGWAILVFILITYYKLKAGPLHYLKSFAEPFAAFTPMNIISEVATPVSMSFRHYGNVLSGSVISVLIATGLQGLSHMIIGKLTSFPLLQIGIPAVLSLYFDIFSGCLQAFIFAMLTMLYISGGFPMEEYFAKKEKKRKKKEQTFKVFGGN